MKRLAWLFAAVVLAAGTTAAAGEPTVKYKKHTEINFEDDTIEGDLTRPDGEHVDARRKVSHANLIKVRTAFRDEILESVGDL